MSLDPQDDPPDDGLPPAVIDAFIARWSAATGTERANYQLFLTELCALLSLPAPEPARGAAGEDTYCFERRVRFEHGDGTASHGFIDLYRRACYVLECKQTGLELDTRGWDKAMLRALGQAVQYVRALPAAEGRPPFVVVVDVGRSIELYSEFSRSGGNQPLLRHLNKGYDASCRSSSIEYTSPDHPSNSHSGWRAPAGI